MCCWGGGTFALCVCVTLFATSVVVIYWWPCASFLGQRYSCISCVPFVWLHVCLVLSQNVNDMYIKYSHILLEQFKFSQHRFNFDVRALLSVLRGVCGIHLLRLNILNALPSETKVVTPADALVALREIRTSELCYACGADVVGEVTGVCTMMQGFVEGRGPSSESILKFSDFYRVIVKRCEYFCSAETPPYQKGKVHFPSEILYGKKALEYRLKDYAIQLKRPDYAGVMDDTKVFRTFAFMLNKADYDRTRQWIKNAIAAESQVARLAIADGASASSEISSAIVGVSVKPSCKTSASSCALLEARPAKALKSRLEEEKKTDVEKSKKAALMTFFTPKLKGSKV